MSQSQAMYRPARKRGPKTQAYKTPIALPEGTVGAYSIKHEWFKPGRVSLVDYREALMTGRAAAFLQIDEPMLVHTLCENRGTHEGVWMSDEPRELRQMAEWIMASKPRGRVLVGGLGLGVVATWLAQRAEVGKIVVVERQQEVIDLVAPHQSGYEVVRADIAEYLRGLPSWDFDDAILDTWQGTGESTWWTEVMPLRRIIARKFGPVRVHCWAEDMMLGQVSQALHNGNHSRVWTFGGVEVHGQRHWYYEGLPDEMTEREIGMFVKTVGLPAWERKYGAAVDANFEKEKKQDARAAPRPGA